MCRCRQRRLRASPSSRVALAVLLVYLGWQAYLVWMAPQKLAPELSQGEGKVHVLEFSKGFVQNRIIEKVDGVEVSPMKIIGDTDKRGTEVHFLPDETIFVRTASCGL